MRPIPCALVLVACTGAGPGTPTEPDIALDGPVFLEATCAPFDGPATDLTAGIDACGAPFDGPTARITVWAAVSPPGSWTITVGQDGDAYYWADGIDSERGATATLDFATATTGRWEIVLESGTVVGGDFEDSTPCSIDPPMCG